MKVIKLRKAVEILGGSPCYDSLKKWAREGKIECCMSPGGGVYYLTENQLESLFTRLGRTSA